MAKRLESDIENDCVNIALSVDIPSAKLDKIKRSWPDRLFFLPAPAGAWIVEFKRPGEKPRPQQKERLETFEALGYPTDVIDSVATFRRLLIGRLERAGFGPARLPGPGPGPGQTPATRR